MRIYKVGDPVKFVDESDGKFHDGKICRTYKNNDRYDILIEGFNTPVNVLRIDIIEKIDNTKTLLDELEELQEDIEERASYLQLHTYEPYQEVKEFADRLRTIINNHY